MNPKHLWPRIFLNGRRLMKEEALQRKMPLQGRSLTKEESLIKEKAF